MATVSTETRVAGTIDHAHAATGEFGGDLVVREGFSDQGCLRTEAQRVRRKHRYRQRVGASAG
jgi:hypothetical protein